MWFKEAAIGQTTLEQAVLSNLRNKEVKSSKRLVRIHIALVVYASLRTVAIFLVRPNELLHLYSVFNLQSTNVLAKFVFLIYEILCVYSISVKFCSCNVFVRLYFKRIKICLQMLKYSTDVSNRELSGPLSTRKSRMKFRHYVSAYKFMQNAVDEANSSWSWPLCLCSGIYFAYIVGTWVTFIKLGNSIIMPMRIGFILAGLSGFIYTYITYEAIGGTYGASKSLLKTFKKFNQDLNFKRQLASFRHLRMQSGNFFPIKDHTYLNFLSFVLTNVLSLLIVL